MPKPCATSADFDLAACEQLMRGGSKSFFAASLVLPARVRAPATALYAFCRVADDTVDVDADRHGGPAGAMRHLHQRLDRIYRCIAAGSALPGDAATVDHALHSVVRRFAIPAALPLALLDGFAWDMAGRRYETLADLHAYAARVAGSVGAMMALVMGVDDGLGAASPSPPADVLARACELGVAMQLTNIARDVGDDARLGRLYLPRAWLRDAGIDADAWLREPRFTPALAGVVQRLLAEADTLYRRAEAGVAALPRDCRVAILAARLVYAEIGREIERAGFDSVNRRAVVGAQRKLALMAKAWSMALSSPARRSSEAALPAVAFLVDAVSAGLTAHRDRPFRGDGDGARQASWDVGAPAAAVAAAPAATAPLTAAARPLTRGGRPPARALGERIGWTIDLFEAVRHRRLAAQTADGSGEAGRQRYGR